MNRILSVLVAYCVVLVLTGSVLAASVEIRLRDGSFWRGDVADPVQVTYVEQNVEAKISGTLVKVADLYVVVEGNIAGEVRQKVIFRADIVSIRTLSRDEPDPLSGAVKRTKSTEASPADDGKLGVFVLPLSGPVGINFRHDEIEALGEEADKYGDGQILVLIIKSNGGLVLEAQQIADTIWDIKKRHRVVMWVEKAISAGAWTAMCADEIYFMTEGIAGSVTTISGMTHVPEEYVQSHIDNLVRVAVESGYSEHIARSMKLKKYMCSYDKDPVTGEVTFYGDLTGKHILSTEEQNLCFTSSVALDCGFSRGTADTNDELAALLDLPEWHEKSDYGRKIAQRWQDTVERCQDEVPRLLVKRQMGTAGDAVENIGLQIRINEQLIRWIEKAPNVCRYDLGLPPREYFERENEELRKMLADMKRRR